MADFYPLGISCNNCGKPLEAAISSDRWNLEYRHEDGTTECVIIQTPRPYSGWLATEMFDAAQAKAWAEADNALDVE